MKIIEGFQSAKLILSRQAPKEVFGGDEREQAVRQIISDVRDRGDAALFDYTLKFDGVKLTSLEVSKKQINDAYREVDSELVSALKLAYERITAFHVKQRDSLLHYSAGPGVGWLVHPLQCVGVYAPGGTASYPSTVLMTAIPARVAGVKEVILTTPPNSGGIVPPLTLVAADIAQVDRVFAVGGAQAIAALAFGTESVPMVDKICGPGNIFVVLAKKLVYGVVGIDGLQGPSEVLIIADETATDSVDEGDVGIARITLDRRQIMAGQTLDDAAFGVGTEYVNATGYLADETTPTDRIVKRIVLDIPEEAHPWAASQNLLLLEDTLCEHTHSDIDSEDETGQLFILSPDANTIYRLSPGQPIETQRIPIEVGSSQKFQ